MIKVVRIIYLRELGWIAQEKYGSVVGNDIPVSLLGAKLDREPTRIPSAVVGA